MSDDLKSHKSLIRRRTFLKAGAYASYFGIGLTLSYIAHEEEEAQAIMPLLVIPVFIVSVAIVNKDFRNATIETSLVFHNIFDRFVNGSVELVFGDFSNAINPRSNDLPLASKQLESRDKAQPVQLPEHLLLASRSEGKSPHDFPKIPPGKSQITCRPFKVPIGSGQKWMYANTNYNYREREFYRFKCH